MPRVTPGPALDKKRAGAAAGKREQQDRYFLSSLPREALTDGQWLLLVRNHWWVENGCHQIWDKIFREDDKPRIQAGEGSCQGTVVVATDADIASLRPRARRRFIPERPVRGARTGAPLAASVA